jgi:hypothetical protein
MTVSFKDSVETVSEKLNVLNAREKNYCNIATVLGNIWPETGAIIGQKFVSGSAQTERECKCSFHKVWQ